MFPRGYFASGYYAPAYFPGPGDVVPEPEADNAERYIRANPVDGATVAERLRPVLPTE